MQVRSFIVHPCCHLARVSEIHFSTQHFIRKLEEKMLKCVSVAYLTILLICLIAVQFFLLNSYLLLPNKLFATSHVVFVVAASMKVPSNVLPSRCQYQGAVTGSSLQSTQEAHQRGSQRRSHGDYKLRQCTLETTQEFVRKTGNCYSWQTRSLQMLHVSGVIKQGVPGYAVLAGFWHLGMQEMPSSSQQHRGEYNP